MGMTPRAFSFASPASVRERPWTVWPSAIAFSAQTEPMYPVAPVMKKCMAINGFFLPACL